LEVYWSSLIEQEGRQVLTRNEARPTKKEKIKRVCRGRKTLWLGCAAPRQKYVFKMRKSQKGKKKNTEGGKGEGLGSLGGFGKGDRGRRVEGGFHRHTISSVST